MAWFKKKIPAGEFVRLKWDYLTAVPRRQKWQELRTSINDPVLTAASDAAYNDNMTAVCLELLGISVVKTQRQDAVVAYVIAKHALLKDQPTINSLESAYSSAFGSSQQDGVAPMVTLFNRVVADGRLSEATTLRLYDEFYGLLDVMFGEFKDLKLVP